MDLSDLLLAVMEAHGLTISIIIMGVIIFCAIYTLTREFLLSKGIELEHWKKSPSRAPAKAPVKSLEELAKKQYSSFYPKIVQEQLNTLMVRANIVRQKDLDFSLEDKLRTVEVPLQELLNDYHQSVVKDDALLAEGVQAAARGMAHIFSGLQDSDRRATTEKVNFLKAKFPEPSSLDFTQNALPLVDEIYVALNSDDTKEGKSPRGTSPSEGDEIIAIMDIRGVTQKEIVVGKRCGWEETLGQAHERL